MRLCMNTMQINGQSTPAVHQGCVNAWQVPRWARLADPIASPHAAQRDLKVGQGFPWLPRDGWADACACPSPHFVLGEGVLPCSAGSREGSS